MKNTTTKPAPTTAEIVAHLTDAQRLQVLTDAATATYEGKPLRAYRGFTAADVLPVMTGDRTPDAKISIALGHSLEATRGEIATMIIARQAARSRPKPDSGIDHDLALALANDDA